MQRRFALPGKAFGQLHGDAFFPDLQQRATKLLAGAVEQLHGVTFAHAQHAADVVRLGFRQFMVAEAQRGVGEKTGQSHFCSLEKCSVGASWLAPVRLHSSRRLLGRFAPQGEQAPSPQEAGSCRGAG